MLMNPTEKLLSTMLNSRLSVARANRWRYGSLLAIVLVGCPLAQADCSMVLSNPTVDFGTLNRSTINMQGGQVALGERSLSINVTCSEPSDMTLLFQAAAESENFFRLGTFGNYQLTLHDAVLDGASVELGEISAPGNSPTKIDSTLVWRPNQGISPVKAGNVVQGQNFQSQLLISAKARETVLGVRDESVLEADAAIELLPAAVSRELTLASKVLPVSCVPTLSNNGEVDFGQISAQQLNRTGSTQLQRRSIQFAVNCDAPAQFAVQAIDNRNGSSTGLAQSDFGLGVDGRGNKIGSYSIAIDNVTTASGVSPSLIRTANAGLSWSTVAGSDATLGKNIWLGFSDLSGATNAPVALEQVSTTLSVDVLIAPGNALSLSDTILLDGSATLEVVYL